MVVEHDDGVAEDAVEFDRDAPAKVSCRHVERAAVPADARVGKRAAVLSISGTTAVGIVTPFGGLCFLAGWACLALAVPRVS